MWFFNLVAAPRRRLHFLITLALKRPFSVCRDRSRSMDDSPDPVFTLSNPTWTHDHPFEFGVTRSALSEVRVGPRTRKTSSPGATGKEAAVVNRNGKTSWGLIGGITLALLFIVVVLQNTQVVRIQFFFWALSMSRIIPLCFALFVGFAVGYYVTRRGGREKTYLIRRAKCDPS